MLYKVLDQGDYEDFIKNLIADHELIGPKKRDKGVHDFTNIKNFSEIDTDYKRTTLPPAKKLLFPSVEKLVDYEVGDKIEFKPVIESSEKILFGINAWDINGMNFLDKVFTTDYVDENYVSKRRKLIVIGMDTIPSETNFSMSMGSEYAKEGFDLYITGIKSGYFIKVATSLGNKILTKYSGAKDASGESFKEYDEYMDDYKKKFKLISDIKSFYYDFEMIYEKDDFWKKTAKDCYSCGSCNLVCPTCFCFNVKDEIELNLKEGTRTREWNSCMMPEYGLVAGGHNFRPGKENRLQQRYRCKLKTFYDKFGAYSCVGCGRCIEACLAKINIAEDMNSVKKQLISN